MESRWDRCLERDADLGKVEGARVCAKHLVRGDCVKYGGEVGSYPLPSRSLHASHKATERI